MTKEELLHKLTDIEWNDFEVKSAQTELPKNIWETVSAFANTSGGWIVLGIEENRKNGISQYQISGVKKPEKQEQDFIGTLRSQTKFNLPIPVQAEKYIIDGVEVLAFYIPSSPIKPVYFNNNLSNTFIRTGSGDQRATEMEILAIQRDQAFGSRSEQIIPNTTLEDLNPSSLQTFRRRIQEFNHEFAYNNLDDKTFCQKTGITYNNQLTYGSLLMLGKRDVVQSIIHNFWIDYIEIPGTSYQDAPTRYTYRMPEQENIWEYYQVLIQRLRLYVDAPFSTGPDGFSPDDNSQLYALREDLVNLLAHADYFSPMHSTIRVFDNRIEFQNPGRFYIDLNRLKEQIISMPRNPNIIKLFRYAKLSENAGYGIDKILKWELLTGQKVSFATDMVCSMVTYFRPIQSGKTAEQSEQTTEKNEYLQILNLMKENPSITRKEISEKLGLSESAVQRRITYLTNNEMLSRIGGRYSGVWKVLKEIP